MTENYEFQSDNTALLDIIIHSIYSKKEIAIRELVSNASDALSKIRYNALTDSSVTSKEPNLFIRIIPNNDDHTLTFWDSGVGMTKDELIKNLGTIAHSSTKKFVESMTNKQNYDDFIGQFGCGFYAAFLIASQVDVYSCHYTSDTVYKWSSTGVGQFTVEQSNDPFTNSTTDGTSLALTRGTKMVLHLKEDQYEFLDETRLKSILKEHSSFINFPIELFVSATNTTTVTDDNTPDEEGKVSDVDDTKKSTSEVQQKTTKFDRINTQQPLWTRDKKEITHDEYTAFYKSLSNDWDEPRCNIHFSAEGATEFKALLYIPKRAPYDAFSRDKNTAEVSLYVRKVFITKCKEIVPEWANFLKGVVDSVDLPLNISRELLQENKVLRTIRKQITKRTIETLQNLLNVNPTEYDAFYQEFGKNIKLGVHEDNDTRTQIASLLTYHTLNHPDKQITLKQYISEMKPEQKSIYYIAGSNKYDVTNSPFVEAFKSKGYDVILMYEAIDEFVIQKLTKYEDKDLCNITQEGLKLDTTSTETQTDYSELFAYVKKVLDNKVTKVTSSQLLAESPCVISSKGLTANMERILKSQAMQDPMSAMYRSQKTFELNTNHKLIQHINEQVKNNTTDKQTDATINILYDAALLSSGFQLENNQSFSKRIFNMLEMTSNLNSLVEISDPVVNDSIPYVDTEENDTEDAGSEISDIDENLLQAQQELDEERATNSNTNEENKENDVNEVSEQRHCTTPTCAGQ